VFDDFRKDVMHFSKASGSSVDAGGSYSVTRSHTRRIIFSVYTFQKCMSESKMKETGYFKDPVRRSMCFKAPHATEKVID
jgi:hypothetical protein